MAKCLGCGYFLIFLIVNLVGAERIKDMIYMNFEGVAACFRRHNGTHQFGCSSSRSGSVGVIHLVEDENDIRWLEHNANVGDYTVILTFSMFTRDILLRLRNTHNINGVLLTKNTSQPHPEYYSPEDTCPNRYSGYKKCQDLGWNPYGSSLLMEDWPFPMFYTENQTLIEAVKSCFLKHNAPDMENQQYRPLCALEMKSFMFAAINSESCIKRSDFKLNFNPTQFCDPLGDRNIYWPLAPINRDKNSIILVTARLDASSLFDGISPGAGNVVTGLVTLLATAYYLNILAKDAVVKNTNVVFSLLNGEAFDYIGSSRFIYDLKEGNFNALGGVNLKFDDIKTVIEFGQLTKGKLFLHSNNAQNDEMIKKIQVALNATVLEDSVPPTSIQSFLKEKPDLTAVVISDHGRQFKNKYYNGILDDAESLSFNRSDINGLATALAKIAVHVAEILYKDVVSTGSLDDYDSFQSVEHHILEMLKCYLESAKCPLFHAASSPNAKLINQVLSLYVGVHRVPNIATTLTGQLLAYLTREEVANMTETTCYENHLIWMAGDNNSGLCINSSVNYSTAMSPAFIIDGYDMKSGVYSTWTESIWQTLSVRMFLKPSAATEQLTMILGSSVAGISFVLVWFINSRADILFNSRAINC
ncbi:nicastrin isoform X2 [Bombus vancouverensis nearcticus]|uniref:Nicastrin n=1 Tax=Bombus bifarius TaxID=103933 RepID=A0A6P8M622_9HYME|nr:nicastrin isoform X2 [Bombus vancouverensis nearcticus]XP_033309036.1 nicastrin isoform X2 [Bombus bifarius]XP_050485870.1 nicastrin isoform X2 [Bombus huntii]